MTTALIGTTKTEFIQSNQEPTPNGPTVVTLSAPLALSLDDVTAILFDLGPDFTADELADDAYVLHLVTDLVFNAGLIEVASLVAGMSEVTPDDDRYGWLCHARRRAAELFPAAAPVTGPARRELALAGGR